jgi:hypothetical protein
VPARLVLYDVSVLYFEADEGDGFGGPGFSQERRLEPQITVAGPLPHDLRHTLEAINRTDRRAH